MNCPVCKRDLAPTLSICLTCGAMMNDSVREELECKIIPSGELRKQALAASLDATGELLELPELTPVRPLQMAIIDDEREMAPAAAEKPPVELPAMETAPEPKPKAAAAAASQTVAAKVSEPKKPLPTPAPPIKREPRAETANMTSKHTNKTLVEFQAKHQTMPDWRLQLQNTIRQRNGGSAAEPVEAPAAARLVTHGANALKAEPEPAPEPPKHENAKVAAALKRIEDSRRAFLPAEQRRPEPPQKAAPANRNYPFNVIQRSPDAPFRRAEPNPPAGAPTKPRLVNSLRIEKKGYDTNRLPPLPKPAKIESSFELSPREISAGEELGPGYRGLREEEIMEMLRQDQLEEEFGAASADEADDLAPLAMRFNAGLFDLIIGTFAAAILLSPFLLAGGEWFSLSGIITFAAVLAVVMFGYLTLSIGYFGRTVGMRLFSLELVDAEENDYPTMHQAAVSSCVYIISLALGGIGFLPVFFTEEKRAAHDLVSGTILVREY